MTGTGHVLLLLSTVATQAHAPVADITSVLQSAVHSLCEVQRRNSGLWHHFPGCAAAQGMSLLAPLVPLLCCALGVLQ